jgi:aminopeptidase N
MVGGERFLSAYREFIRRWEGKHPTPFDLFYTMNDVLDENFNWFWNAWFMDFGYPDLCIELKGNEIIVRRVGGRALPLPVNLTIEYEDGTSTNLSRPMDVWKDGAREIRLEMENVQGIKNIGLDTENVPDIDPGNNHICIE